MKNLLQKLTEALETLESPDLPEEDKWKTGDLFDWNFTVIIDSPPRRERFGDAKKLMTDYINHLHQQNPNLGFNETNNNYLKFSPIKDMPFRGMTAYQFEIEGPWAAFDYFNNHSTANDREYPHLARSIDEFQDGFVYYGRIISLLW